MIKSTKPSNTTPATFRNTIINSPDGNRVASYKSLETQLDNLPLATSVEAPTTFQTKTYIKRDKQD